MNKTEYQKDKYVGDIVKSQCEECMRSTNHKICSSYTNFTTSGDSYDYVSFTASYQIVKCQGCDHLSFRKFSTDDTDCYHDEDGNMLYYEEIELYTKRSGDMIAVKDILGLPDNLAIIYKEIIQSYNGDCFILAAAGLRAIIDGLCTDLKIKNGIIEKTDTNGNITEKTSNNLDGKISGLHQKSYLTKENADILHQHRYLGNEALHELKQPSHEELKLAIEIIEHVLESIYEFRQKGKELAKKRDQRKKTP